ncbi:protein phosphatase 1 regulatory subunit 37 [Protopterus annectens]|uniref:protein phosphatase 1 regulatory subunit 37 n=1 Tax=Protopterus annectens TaxID=7888 RepID=UPI001CFB6E92|nr:protein phosphatase 1 regulatory subunit 37 [Protopterus annectens]XP_043942442.1 protein phosphatase 1 regulatory subunit 37 [Protopterus annectens]
MKDCGGVYCVCISLVIWDQVVPLFLLYGILACQCFHVNWICQSYPVWIKRRQPIHCSITFGKGCFQKNGVVMFPELHPDRSNSSEDIELLTSSLPPAGESAPLQDATSLVGPVMDTESQQHGHGVVVASEEVIGEFPASSDGRDETSALPNNSSFSSGTLAQSALLSPSSSDGSGKSKTPAKHVTFPSDEDIVSGSVEPKNPWRHAQNATVAEITEAYKQACQKLNCKPIAKLLKQIQDFKDLAQRIECMDLKGEKLDYKACESLEEIFKRVQFKLVDLEQTSLDEDGASALFDMIEYYESATHLNISFNKHIGTRGWQAAAHMMRKSSCLEFLDARNTPLLDQSAPFVARALRISSSLSVLHLENTSLSGRPLMLLATALKLNMNLRELYLADNKLNGLQDSAQLGNLLKFNCYIQILDLRNNHILDSGLAYICEGLKEQRKGLVTLVLWNNQLTHSGMAYLGMTLPHTQSLETLNLGHNPIGNEGVRNLKSGLIANRSVLRLGLASTKINCEGAVAVAEFIAESPRLLRLDLRENDIKTGGLMALSLALKVNQSLLRLDLDREPKKETVKSFIETQKALLTEIQNGCKRNFIQAKEKEEQEQQMQHSASMPEITVEKAEEVRELEKLQNPDEAEVALEEGESIQVSAVVCDGTVKEGNVTAVDSDTDDEDEEHSETVNSCELAHKDANDSRENDKHLPVPQECTQDSPEVSCVSCNLNSQTEKMGNEKCETETSRTASAQQSASSPKNEQKLSISSPGRGSKIFVVTRVESPPQQIVGVNHGQQVSMPHSVQSQDLASNRPVSTAPFPSLESQTKTTVSAPVLDSYNGVPLDSTDTLSERKASDDCDYIVEMNLPNGLKPELVYSLPGTAGSYVEKAATCAVEHEVIFCKEDEEVEQLLREASQEVMQEVQ